jgi:hypothetical protein
MSKKQYTMIAKDLGSEVEVGSGGCPNVSCPAVLKTENGESIVIGYILDPEEVADIENTGKVRVYKEKGEVAIRVKTELLIKAAPHL